MRIAFFLTMAVFALQPFALGAWLALIPHVKATLGLSKSTLALCLLGMPIALIPALNFASRAVSRFGPRRTLMVMFPIQALSFVLPVLAGGTVSLFAALALNGAVMAFLQAGLNVYAGRLEKKSGLIVMGRCHGAWALGLMGGSLAVTISADLPKAAALLLVSVPTSFIGVFVANRLPRLGEVEGGTVAKRRRAREIPPAVYYVSLFALAIAMTEGAMSDWAAVYLAERLPADATHSGIAVSIYAGFLAAGRFASDAAKSVLGSVYLARVSIMLAITGLLFLILPLPLTFAYLGFSLIGLGASVGFPLGVSAVAQLDDTYEAQNIALMSMLSICGFLAGPPLIGFVADAFSLRVGLSILLPLLALSLTLSGWLRPAVEKGPAGSCQPG